MRWLASLWLTSPLCERSSLNEKPGLTVSGLASLWEAWPHCERPGLPVRNILTKLKKIPYNAHQEVLRWTNFIEALQITENSMYWILKRPIQKGCVALHLNRWHKKLCIHKLDKSKGLLTLLKKLHFNLCHLSHVISHVMSCHVMSCHVMSC